MFVFRVFLFDFLIKKCNLRLRMSRLLPLVKICTSESDKNAFCLISVPSYFPMSILCGSAKGEIIYFFRFMGLIRPRCFNEKGIKANLKNFY